MKIPWMRLWLAIQAKNRLLRECLGVEYSVSDAFDELDEDIANNYY